MKILFYLFLLTNLISCGIIVQEDNFALPEIIGPNENLTINTGDVSIFGRGEPSFPISVVSGNSDCSTEVDMTGNWSCVFSSSSSRW